MMPHAQPNSEMADATKSVGIFVCVASCVVGLLFSALSSSLNILRKWIWWKILLYFVCGFFICSILLFITARQRSTPYWLKAHLTFFALIATIIYSLVFDTVVDVKPDAYSVISCASFAIMFLCLSRLTQLGFEIEFQYFFCVDLIVQLWKIEHWLVIIGGCFIYFLVVIPLLSLKTPEEHVQLQEVVVIPLLPSETPEERLPPLTDRVVNPDGNSTVNTPPGNGDDDSTSLLGLNFPSDDRVVTQSNSRSQEDNGDDSISLLGLDFLPDDDVGTQSNSRSQGENGDGLIRLKHQLMDCIEVLEKENQRLVPMVCSHVDKYLKANVDIESSDKYQIRKPQLDFDVYFMTNQIRKPQLYSDVNFMKDALPPGIITRLRDTVKQMTEAGFERKCYDMYSNWRREFLEQCLSALGLQLQAEDVEKWIKTCKVAGEILFPNEMRLFQYVFSEFNKTVDVSFTKVCQELTIRLLSFADTIITTGSYLPNLLSSIIPKMSESLLELHQNLNSLTCDWSVLQIDVIEVRRRLGILIDLASLVYHNTEQATVDGGGLHPITWQVMNYIRDVCRSHKFEFPTQHYRMVPDREGKSSFSMLIATMIELLESNLEAKSRDYTDPALAYVFMINNLRYIRQEAYKLTYKSSKSKLDDDWFRQNTAKVEQNCKFYQSSWDKLLDFLKLESNESMEGNLVSFNRHFWEICNVQSTWIISDEKLREQIIESIKPILLRAYGEFFNRFQDAFGKHTYKHIEYGFDDIQNCLSHLFLLSEQTNPLLEEKKRTSKFAWI